MKHTMTLTLTLILWFLILTVFASGCGGGGTLFILNDARGMPVDDIEDIKLAVLQCMRQAGDWKETKNNDVWELQLRKGPLKTITSPGQQDVYIVGLTNHLTRKIEISTFNRIDPELQVNTFWATALGHEMVHVYLGAFDSRNDPHSHRCFRTFDDLARYHACDQVAKLKNQPKLCDWIRLEVKK